MNVVECRDLTKIYTTKKALSNVSFQIKENSITGLIGRNGAGKTTLLKILTGFYTKTSGEVKVFSEDPFNNLKASLNTIFTDDQMQFPISLSLQEILDVSQSFYPNWDGELARGLMDYFRLPANAYYQNLSKGMKSIFNAIVGLSARCALTIFDEPTTGMDRAVRQDFYRALLKAYMEYPRTIILSSHLIYEMENLLENILLIKNGEIILHLPVEQLEEFAISITGPAKQVNEFASTREVLHEKELGAYEKYAVIRKEQNDEMRATGLGLEVQKVQIDDLCMYLTSQTKGGIDDVFKRS